MTKFSIFKRIALIAIFLGTIIAGIFIFTKINSYSKDFTKLDRGRYIVAYSHRFFKGNTRFVLYDEDGNILEDIYKKNFQALQFAKKVDNGYVFTSERKNRHAFINKIGKFSEFSIDPQKYAPHRNFGTSTFNVFDEYMISSLNIGTSERGYLCEISYQKGINKPQTNIPLWGGWIDSLLVKNNILYAHYSNDQADKGGFYIIDLIKEKLINNVILDNLSVATISKNKIKFFNDNKMILVDYTLNTVKSKLKMPMLVEFDLITNKITKKVPFEESFLPAFVEIYNNKIYIISKKGEIKVLNSNYETVSEYSLSDNVFNTIYEGKQAEIRGLSLLKNNHLQVFYEFGLDKKNYQMPSVIHYYDLTTGKFLKRIPFKLPNEKKWWGECISYVDLKE